MKLFTKLALTLITAGSLTACGGVSTDVPTLQDHANDILPINHNVNVAAADTNNNGNLEIEEMRILWNSLSQDEKSTIAGSAGMWVEDIQAVLDTTTEESLNDVLGINKLKNDISIQYNHDLGVTGEGVNIVVIDDFSGSEEHGQKVINVLSNIAYGSDFKRGDAGNGQYIDGERAWDLYVDAQTDGETNIINLSFEVFDDTIVGTTIQDYRNSRDPQELAWEETLNQALVTVAAGNSGTSCSELASCNLVAVDLHASGAPIIVVGALNDRGIDSPYIHDTALDGYSTEAGILKDVYLASPVSRLYPDVDGTSFAAPYVAGVAALMMDKFDMTDPYKIRNILFETADDLGVPGIDVIYGNGALNAGNALSPLGELK